MVFSVQEPTFDQRLIHGGSKHLTVRSDLRKKLGKRIYSYQHNFPPSYPLSLPCFSHADPSGTLCKIVYRRSSHNYKRCPFRSLFIRTLSTQNTRTLPSCEQRGHVSPGVVLRKKGKQTRSQHKNHHESMTPKGDGGTDSGGTDGGSTFYTLSFATIFGIVFPASLGASAKESEGPEFRCGMHTISEQLAECS
uniref:Uncharacterized protein n=1 Tax=Steinernema glaseri TaxID=37863 RepID=A0A1I7YPJ7_9BILA